MGVFRQFTTDDDGESHIKDIDLAQHPELLTQQPTVGMRFHVYPPGTFLDWHPATGYNCIVVLSGVLEIGVTDGTLKRFYPGDARLTSDRGKGHTGRAIGDEPCAVLHVKITE
jgi:hypothetical protein